MLLFINLQFYIKKEMPGKRKNKKNTFISKLIIAEDFSTFTNPHSFMNKAFSADCLVS